MSCTITKKQFRLMDARVGWDEATVESLGGLTQEEGIQLVLLSKLGHTVCEALLSQYILPARLTRDCKSGHWFLITPAPPSSRILMYQNCPTEERSAAHGIWSPLSITENPLDNAITIASGFDQIAVVDKALNSILFFDHTGQQLGQTTFNATSTKIEKVRICTAPWGEWLAIDVDHKRLIRIDRAGIISGDINITFPGGAIDRMAFDLSGHLWLAVSLGQDQYELWRSNVSACKFLSGNVTFELAPTNQLLEVFPSTGLNNVATKGFCFHDVSPKKICAKGCYSWFGRAIEPLALPDGTEIYAKQGQLLTYAIDSGIPRVQWHRLRAEANVPNGCKLEIAIATSEAKNPGPQGHNDLTWGAFGNGIPHPSDWQIIHNGEDDVLIVQPAGRYSFVRIRMTGNGFNTPTLRSLRLDFPRATSIDLLPAVYRQEIERNSFSERFIALFDTYLEEIDDVIERFPALFDASAAPEEVLTWLGEFLGLTMDTAWDAKKRREVLQQAPSLYRMRGTKTGLIKAINLIFGFEPLIKELSLERPWSSVGNTHLNYGFRLFGTSSWRFYLDRSRLGKSPLRSFSKPELDPFNAGAYKFELHIPVPLEKEDKDRLQILVDAQKPAHTSVSIRYSEDSAGFILGYEPHLGIDTALVAPPVTVLNGPTVSAKKSSRLGRNIVLSKKTGTTHSPIQLDRFINE